MKLTEKQKKYLRGLAHQLKPGIQVGSSGITPGLLRELHQTLEHHELIKVKIRTGDRATRDATIDQLAEKSSASLIARVGNVATLYRPRRKDPQIVLPPAPAPATR